MAAAMAAEKKAGEAQPQQQQQPSVYAADAAGLEAALKSSTVLHDLVHDIVMSECGGGGGAWGCCVWGCGVGKAEPCQMGMCSHPLSHRAGVLPEDEMLQLDGEPSDMTGPGGSRPMSPMHTSSSLRLGRVSRVLHGLMGRWVETNGLMG